MDVVVTDRSGNPVTDLKPGDFVVFQDGKEQKITNLTYIDFAARRAPGENAVSKAKSNDRNATTPPVGIRSNRGRIVTFVVDDGNCLATVDGTVRVREALRRFVDEQMQPDDRVAIYRTAGGSSLMQLYTSNRELLKRKINQINLITQGNCGSSFDPARDQSTLKATGKGADSFESESDKEFKKEVESRDRDDRVIGTLGVLNVVVDRLRNAPQRKIVFLLSEGINYDIKSRTFGVLRELADKASRASVVINTMSAKGATVPGMILAQDEVLPGIINGADQTTALTESRLDEERELNMGLGYLAYSTGGKFIRNQNFLDVPLKKALDAETGYYLIGYQPDEETFKGKGFHKIEIKTTRPGLIQSSRKGFYGVADKEVTPTYKNPDSQIYQAINSPFNEEGIDISMTTLLSYDPKAGNRVNLLVHLPGKDLEFLDAAGGAKKTSLDVVAVLMDDKGKVVEEFNRNYPITVPQQGISTVRLNGLDFSTDIAIKSPGVYSLRVAVRDTNSKRLGTAGDFVDVPNLSKGDLLVTGLITTPVDAAGKPVLPKERPINAAFAPVFTPSTPSVRSYTKGTVLAYAYSIYNAKNGPDGRPDLVRELKLYKDGKLVADIPDKPVDQASMGGPARYNDFGILRLTDAVEAGEYILQVAIRDRVSNKTSSRWIDFEVVE